MVCKDHHAELASTLIHIFCQYDRVVPILTACLKKSIDKEGTSTHIIWYYIHVYIVLHPVHVNVYVHVRKEL